jgi:hypothetical protein
MNNIEPVRNTERVVVMMPPALTALLDAEAERAITTRSELIRRTPLERLRANAEGRPVS